ncbi:MAG: hypothetical protein LN414_06090, partial [Candidatus Thermoplasmatota archaeon]|nr:hypothetical protein [Candidatus Thermoplasmatota archaeon]
MNDSDLEWDPGADGWWNNTDFDNSTDRPAYVFKDGALPADPRFMFMSDAQAVDWDTFNVSTIAQDSLVPGHVLMTPGGDRADVQAKGVYGTDNWTVEFKRLRDTGSSNDVIFDRVNVPYAFASAVANNKSGEDHSKGVSALNLWLAEPEMPDQIIRTIGPMTLSPTVNSTLEVGVSVMNIGWTDAGVSKFSVYWDEPGAPAALLVDAPAVDWGAYKSIEFNVSTQDLTAGNNTLVVVADAEDVISEINETNNMASTEVLLGEEPLPNLIVDDMGMDPVDLTTRAYTEVSVAVVNGGDIPSPEATIVLYLDDIGNPITTETLPAIDNGDSWLWHYTWGPVDLPEGEHVLNVTVDPDGDIKESNETDNSLGLPFTMTAITLPDLVIEEVTPLDTTVTQGDETRTRVVVGNIGGVPVTEDFEVALFLDQPFTIGTVGLMATAEVTDDIPAGDNATVILIWTVPGDTDVGSDHFIRAEVDWYKAIEEVDDSTNNGTFDGLVVTLRELPDLTVPMVVPTNPTVRMGSRVTFNITVRNEGAKATSINTTLLFKDLTNNESIEHLAVPEMEVGETIYLEYEWFVDVPNTGSITLQFLVDPLNHIAEEDEFNNAIDNQVTVEPPDLPDLTIPEDGITFFPEVPRIGEAVTISCIVENLGSNSSGITTTVGVWLGNNRILEADLLPLGPGERRTLDMVWPANQIQTPLDYTLIFRVDPDNSIKELDTANNEREAMITFVRPPAPELENLEVPVSKDKVKDGDSVGLTVSIDNTVNTA